MKIVCFGDSITWGAWDSQGGWVTRLRKKTDQICIQSGIEKFILLYNLGISSDTSERVLARMQLEISARALEEGDFAFLVSLGTNDSTWLRHEQRYRIELEQFTRNMTDIVTVAKQYSDQIALIGSTGVDETKTRPYSWDASVESSNVDIQRYDKASEGVAAQTGVAFIPIFDAFMANDPVSMLLDGVHPNDRGHEFLANRIWPTVSNWI